MSEWTAFGNTLCFGHGADDYHAFPGDAASAQQIADAHNRVVARLEEQLDDVMRAGDLEHARNVALLERAERAAADAASLRSLAHQLVEDIIDLTSYSPETALELGAGERLLAELHELLVLIRFGAGDGGAAGVEFRQ